MNPPASQLESIFPQKAGTAPDADQAPYTSVDKFDKHTASNVPAKELETQFRESIFPWMMRLSRNPYNTAVILDVWRTIHAHEETLPVEVFNSVMALTKAFAQECSDRYPAATRSILLPITDPASTVVSISRKSEPEEA